mmetsp:Transcript_7098/g.24432  ORF Transcript_7098/g.24432 Transcript_7098/m.24432 type:complete len:217 (-) Transcript_7098:2005-2655(-)
MVHEVLQVVDGDVVGGVHSALGPHPRHKRVQRVLNEVVAVRVPVVLQQPVVQVSWVARRAVQANLPTRQAHGDGRHETTDLADGLGFDIVAAPLRVALFEQGVARGGGRHLRGVLDAEPGPLGASLSCAQGPLERRGDRKSKQERLRQFRAHLSLSLSSPTTSQVLTLALFCPWDASPRHLTRITHCGTTGNDGWRRIFNTAERTTITKERIKRSS